MSYRYDRTGQRGGFERGEDRGTVDHGDSGVNYRRKKEPCYKCNRTGHVARECPPKGGFERGGEREDCGTVERGGSGGNYGRGREKCYKCFRPGHFARECKETEVRCYRCNHFGHIANDCPQPADEPTCYYCKKTGHIARDCPKSYARAGRARGGVK